MQKNKKTKKAKKTVAVLCAAAILLTPVQGLAASSTDFVDFPNDWSSQALEAAVENGLLGGVGNGMIAPGGALTRAQMAAIINRAFGAEDAASLDGYTDVAADAWYYVDMAKAVEMGTFVGSGGGLLQPERNITREEAFSVLSRAFHLETADTSVLDTFTDAADVSAWAKGAVAAMVANGYVNGSDNARLNPKATITRAEFAAVMSNLVARYIDHADDVNTRAAISGNVVIRGDGLSLEGLQVDGDLLIADGCDTLSLSDSTIDKRLVIRGGDDQITLENVNADSTLVDNPNHETTLVEKDSDLGTLNVASDLIFDGEEKSMMVADASTVTIAEGSHVDEIVVEADDVTITGEGSVDKVIAKADNVVVETEGTVVTDADGSEVSGGDSDDNGDNDGTTGGGGSDNTGGSNGGGGNNGTDPDNDTEAADDGLVQEAHSKLVDLGWSQYVTVQFNEGNSLENCTLTVDGVDVTDAFTPVTDDGSIVKWEISELNPAELTIEKGGESQTITLSNNADPEAPRVEKDTAPDYIMAHGPVAYWDYYLTNYDDNGNVRVEPSKTTFDLSDTAATDVPAFYSADAELSAAGTGQVTITFDVKSEAGRQWFADVADNKAKTVQLVAYNENKNTLNDNLAYTKNSDGTITIALGQSNFTSNGRYYVRVFSQGHDTALVPIHVVNEQAPTLKLSGSGSAIQSGEKVTFSIKDMTYGITNPTYAAELTRPDGETVMLTMIDDWYQIGDSLYLYNDKTNNIPYNGTYTLTVHSNGFKDMSCTFTVTGGHDVPEAAQAQVVDAVSRATSGGSGEGGGEQISANLKYDADLLVNAMVLDDLGLANDAAKGIVNRWENEMAGWDTAYTADGTGYEWEDYINEVNDAEQNGDYLSFSEYIEDAAEDQSGNPYSIKAVLEDNLLGDIQQGGSWIGQEVPTLTLVDAAGESITAVKEGQNVIVKAADADYFAKLESVTVNNNALPLDQSKYTVRGDTLTIDADALTLDERNSITLRADGYKAATLSVLYEADIEEDLSLTLDKDTYERGDDVVITVEGSDGDYLENLSSVIVYKPDGSQVTVMSAEAGGTSTHYYTVEGNKLTLSDEKGTLFDQNGDYSVSLTATHYSRLDTPRFSVSGDLAAAPAAPTGSKDSDGNYVLTFDGDVDNSWKEALTVTVNGTAYKQADWFGDVNKNQYEWGDDGYGNAALTLHKSAFTDGDNSVTLSAAGFDTLTVQVNGENGAVNGGGGSEGSGETTEGKDAPTPIAYAEDAIFGAPELVFWNQSSDNEEVSAYLNAVTGLTLNGTTYEKATGSLWGAVNQFAIHTETGNYTIEFSEDSAWKEGGNNVFEITADGYKTLKVTVDSKGNITADNTDAGETPDEGTGEDTEQGAEAKVPYEWVITALDGQFSGHKLNFDNTGNADVTTYLNAITSITVDDTAYEKTQDAFPDWTTAVYKLHTGTDQFIEFGTNAFENGSGTVTIQADGYQDLILTLSYENGTGHIEVAE